MLFGDPIADVDGLCALYRQPHELVLRQQIDHVDAAARAFIAASPFVVLTTASEHGTDASPRGGPPGFVAVLDDNRLDSHANLLAHPIVGLLFLVPGVDETLRVKGRATLTTDPVVLEAAAIDGRVPKLALGIDVEECFIHCAKAFRRSRLWDTSPWPGPDEQPSAACALGDHLELDVAPEVITADLEAGHAATMWEPCG